MIIHLDVLNRVEGLRGKELFFIFCMLFKTEFHL